MLNLLGRLPFEATLENFAKKKKYNGVPHVVSTMYLVDINVIFFLYIAQKLSCSLIYYIGRPNKRKVVHNNF
jgi:hypothetical protein